MSGPVTQQDTTDATTPATTPGATLEITPARSAEVGGLTVHRALPRRGRRTVGAWCFADHLAPQDDAPAEMLVGPHPHIGLQTVTWLLGGQVLHTDSMGSEQTIRPGQLNLMTAGRGVAHAEETLDATGMHAIQLWIAQPETTRNGAPAFEHHAELPRIDVDGARITVINGTLANVTSPARSDTALVGAEIALHGTSATLPLRRDFEHALVVLDGSVQIDDTSLEISALAYLGSDRDEVRITGTPGSRALLLGGEPFEAEPLMWWNFVARSHDEIEQARRDWEDAGERFGTVRSRLARIPAPPPPQVRLR